MNHINTNEANNENVRYDNGKHSPLKEDMFTS